MSTVAYDTTKQEAKEFAKMFKSAVCSGIVGDKAHAYRGSYHIGRRWCPNGHYSVIRADDKTGPDDGAAAIDMSMNKADMVTFTKRVRAVWLDKTDPRRKYFNAVNGWLGSGDAIRMDFVSGKKSYATPDHKWHGHVEGRRKWIKSKTAADARLSVYRGESKAAYLKSIGVETTPAAPSTGSSAPVTPKAPPYPGSLLKRGSSGAAVKTWQARLVARGYKSVGKADGAFGPNTEKATKTFQKACKISADGIVGPKTWPLAWTKPL